MTAHAEQLVKLHIPGAALAQKLAVFLGHLRAERCARRRLAADIAHLRTLDLHMLDDMGVDATRLHALEPVIACTSSRL